MRTFTLYVHDDRYTVPNMVFLEADHAEKAAELANHELNKSEHYLAVDVREGDDFCCRVTRRGKRDGLPLDQAGRF
jgi:hypothetical protein